MITLDQVLELKPCYSRDKLLQMSNGHEALSLQEVIDLDIDFRDRLWLILKLMNPAQRIELAREYAEQVAPLAKSESKDESAANCCARCAIRSATESEGKTPSTINQKAIGISENDINFTCAWDTAWTARLAIYFSNGKQEQAMTKHGKEQLQLGLSILESSLSD